MQPTTARRNKAAEIRHLAELGLRQVDIARRVGVQATYVYSVLKVWPKPKKDA